MSSTVEKRLTQLLNSGQQTLLTDNRMGIEKECLRVAPDGNIAQTPHPSILGSALTNPYVTTDYSEALLEFITPPYADLRDAMAMLCDIHRFVYEALEDELIWATSMPCVVAGEESIPIARYGTSNAGKMKHIYRRGLGYRYGKVMQVIAGVHFNFSLAESAWPHLQALERDSRSLKDFVSDKYFCLIRNLQRFGWLVPYLFGASPAVCKSFLAGQPTPLQEFDKNTYFEPFGTSLRMSDMGYQNKKKAGVRVSYDNLEAYTASLTQAIGSPHPEYQAIGVVVDGEYRQLNANILQIENEYYSSMRPKQVPLGNEKPVVALTRRGVQYVELRSVDVSAFDPMGVSEEQLNFLRAFLLYCLLHDSPPIGAEEREAIDYNLTTTGHRGRDPALQLRQNGNWRALREWAWEICEEMQGICEILDAAVDDTVHTRSLAQQFEAIRDADRTPSARILAEMRDAGEGFFHFAMRMSQHHQNSYKNLKLSDAQRKHFAAEAEASLERQRALEAADDIPFEEFLRRYFAQT